MPRLVLALLGHQDRQLADVFLAQPCCMVHVGGPFLLIECGNPIVSRNGPPLRERHTYQLLRQLIPPGL